MAPRTKGATRAGCLAHDTRPLGRAVLIGDLRELGALVYEYWEEMQLGSGRAAGLQERVLQELAALQLPDLLQGNDSGDPLDAADGYLCELKEAQVRTGLHRFGRLPEPDALAELLACLARAPQEQGLGLTQALARDHNLLLDPWADPEEAALLDADRDQLLALGLSGARLVGDGVAWLAEPALRCCATLQAPEPVPVDSPPGGVASRGVPEGAQPMCPVHIYDRARS